MTRFRCPVVIISFITLGGVLSAQTQLSPEEEWIFTPRSALTAEQRLRQDQEPARHEVARRYPDAEFKDSPLAKEIERITSELKTDKDPLLRSPGAPLFIATLAATNIGVAPRRVEALCATGAERPKSGVGQYAPVGTQRGTDGLLRVSDKSAANVGEVVPEFTNEYHAYLNSQARQLAADKAALEELVKKSTTDESHRALLQRQIERIDRALRELNR